MDGPAVKLGAFLYSGAAPFTKKWARSEGMSGSLHNSLSTWNWTCFLGFLPPVGRHHSAVPCPWIPGDLGHNLRFSREWWSCWSPGQDCGVLGEGNWHWLRCAGEELWCCLNPLLPLEWVLLPSWDHLFCHLTSRAWSSSSRAWDYLRLLESIQLAPFCLVGWFWSYAQRAPFTAPSWDLLAVHWWTCWVLPHTCPYGSAPWLTGGQSA